MVILKLEELSKTTDNYPIKKCQNCGMYFIPNSKLDEIIMINEGKIA